MGQYTGTIPADLGQISIDIIYPATDKHISKHEEQQYFMASLEPPVAGLHLGMLAASVIILSFPVDDSCILACDLIRPRPAMVMPVTTASVQFRLAVGV